MDQSQAVKKLPAVNRQGRNPFLVFLCLLFALPFAGAEAQYSEVQVKAALIYHFGISIGWPANKTAESFRIAILSKDSSLYRTLDGELGKRQINGLPVKLTLSDSVPPLTKVHMLVADREFSRNTRKLYELARGLHVLLVTDQSNEPLYVLINFEFNRKDGKLSYAINAHNLESENLSYSPNLLLKGGTVLDMKQLYARTYELLTREGENLKKLQDQMNILENSNARSQRTAFQLQGMMDSLDQVVREREAQLSLLTANTSATESLLTKQSMDIQVQKQRERLLKEELEKFNRNIHFSKGELDSINTEIRQQLSIIQSQEGIITERDEQIESRDQKISTQKKNLNLLISFLSLFGLVALMLVWAFNSRRRMYRILEKLVEQRTQELKESQDYFQSLFENSPIAFLEQDLTDTRVLIQKWGIASANEFSRAMEDQNKLMELLMSIHIPTLNPAAVKMFQAPDKDTLRRNMHTIINPNSIPMLRKAALAYYNEDALFECDGQFSTFSSERLEVIFAWIQMPGFGKQHYRILLTFTDITPLKKYEEELRQHRDNLESLVNERSSQIVNLNDELLSANVALTRQKKQLEDTLSSLQSAQIQLVQSEKMASLGMLSAGIAHEINNPINFISGGNQLLRIQIDSLLSFVHSLESQHRSPDPAYDAKMSDFSLAESEQSIHEVLSMITHGIERTTEIIRSLSLYSRGGEEVFIRYDIRRAISQTLLLLKNRYKSHIEVVENFEEVPEIECIPAKLSQVFVNLLSNAIDAIDKKGVIRIDVTYDQEREVVISRIADNGHGIPEELRERVFDPFYTTKDVGKGTGLGLYIAYQVIQQHQARIDCKSMPGEGTEFVIHWPLAQKQSNG